MLARLADEVSLGLSPSRPRAGAELIKEQQVAFFLPTPTRDSSCPQPGLLSTPQEAQIFISVNNKAPVQRTLTKLKKVHS